MISYFINSYRELLQVTWPSNADLISKTALVVVFTVLCALVLMGMDSLFGGIFYTLISYGRV